MGLFSTTPPSHMQDDDKQLTPFRPDESLPDSQSVSAELDTDEVRELVEQAQSGDAEALNALFSRYHTKMVEVARRRIGAKLRLKEDADDLAQTTFREATRDFTSYEYRGKGSLLRWLMQILSNKVKDKAEYYSANKRDMSRERSVEDRRDTGEGTPKALDFSSPDLSVTRVVQRDEEFEILRTALKDLSPDHRRAITLVFFRGMGLREAGEHMDGRSEDAVRMLLRRAEKHLHELTASRLAR